MTSETRLKKNVGEVCQILVWLDFDCINNKSITWSNADLKSEKPWFQLLASHLWTMGCEADSQKKKEIEWFACETGHLSLELSSFRQVPNGSRYIWYQTRDVTLQLSQRKKHLSIWNFSVPYSTAQQVHTNTRKFHSDTSNSVCLAWLNRIEVSNSDQSRVFWRNTIHFSYIFTHIHVRVKKQKIVSSMMSSI